MSGNGVDLGQIVSILQSVLQSVEQMRADFAGRFDEIIRTQDIHSRRLDQHARQLSDQASQIAELRKEVVMYHASVVGHGIHTTELESRVRRIEEHLNLV